MFAEPLDICNRAVQHVGATRMSSLTEDSVQAGECSFVYDKTRRAELRRNVWRFAIKKTALRPIDTTTMLLSPALYSSTTTYAQGALVVDAQGIVWQSKIQSNLGNEPGTAFNAWDVYTGPMTVSQFDSTGQTVYFAGEIVYEAPGDGTYAAYLSRQSSNSQDPRAPSLWVATTTYQKNQVVRYDAAYASGTTYAAGDVVRYSGVNYVSLASSNTGNQPDTSSAWWKALSLVLAPDFYDAATTYSSGDFVTFKGLNYVSIADSNTGNAPDVSASYWAAMGTGTTYVSLIDLNLDQDPSTASAAIWDSATTYGASDSVGASDGYIYTSVGAGNLGHDPALDTAGTYWTNTNVLNPWTTVNSFGSAHDQWITLGVALIAMNIIYPLGSGPWSQSGTKNIYRLPANFLRMAPEDPKAGSVSPLGAPSGLPYEDLNLEGEYFVTSEYQPIVLRFCADIQDVSKFDDMYCEGLGARIALAICEKVTQSTAKLVNISKEYDRFMSEARMVNGIETGPTEPPEDDYITCRT